MLVQEANDLLVKVVKLLRKPLSAQTHMHEAMCR